jgi:hypothetical protein
MNGSRWPRVIALVVFCLLSSAALAQEPDGLVKVRSRQVEMAWLRPGADFRPYTKVIVDRTQVAFRPDYIKDYNLNAGTMPRLTPEDANKIMAAAQTNFDSIFVDAFKQAGYEVVTTTGPDVLRVNSGILDLNVNAPLSGTDGQTQRIITAGDAALIVEVRDTVTNALLGRVADRRETQRLGLQIATSASLLFDFRQLFTLWANICVKGLTEMKAVSPVPKDLKPNQSL